MTKRHLSSRLFAGALRYLETKYVLVETRGAYWTEWRLNGKIVATSCDSPCTGPDYGSWRWVDHDLTIGAKVVVQRSRYITWTEAHIINERIDYLRRYGKPQPLEQRTVLIPDVERAYESILANKGFKGRVGAGSFSIYWNECVRLD